MSTLLHFQKCYKLTVKAIPAHAPDFILPGYNAPFTFQSDIESFQGGKWNIEG